MGAGKFKDVMMRSMLVAATPSTKEELMMVADALRIWHEHPELRNELVDRTGVTANRMMSACAMVFALIKFGVEPREDEDFAPPTGGDDDEQGSDQGSDQGPKESS